MELLFIQKVFLNLILRPGYSFLVPKKDPLFDHVVNTVLSLPNLSDIDIDSKDFTLECDNDSTSSTVQLFFDPKYMPDNLQHDVLLFDLPYYLRHDFLYVFGFAYDSGHLNSLSCVIKFNQNKKHNKDINFYNLMQSLPQFTQNVEKFKLDKTDAKTLSLLDVDFVSILDCFQESYVSAFKADNDFVGMELQPSNLLRITKTKNPLREIEKVYNSKLSIKAKIDNLAKKHAWYLALVYILVRKIKVYDLLEILISLIRVDSLILPRAMCLSLSFFDIKKAAFADEINYNGLTTLVDAKFDKAYDCDDNVQLAYLSQYYYPKYEVVEDSEEEINLLESLKSITLEQGLDYSSHIIPFLDIGSETIPNFKKIKDAFLQLYPRSHHLI